MLIVTTMWSLPWETRKGSVVVVVVLVVKYLPRHQWAYRAIKNQLFVPVWPPHVVERGTCVPHNVHPHNAFLGNQPMKSMNWMTDSMIGFRISSDYRCFVSSFYGSVLFNRIQTNKLFTSYHPVHVNISMSVPCILQLVQYTWMATETIWFLCPSKNFLTGCEKCFPGHLTGRYNVSFVNERKREAWYFSRPAFPREARLTSLL